MVCETNNMCHTGGHVCIYYGLQVKLPPSWFGSTTLLTPKYTHYTGYRAPALPGGKALHCACSTAGVPLWKQMCLWWPWHWSSSSCRMFWVAFLSRFTVMPWHSLLMQCSTACTLTMRFFGSVSPFHLVILCNYIFGSEVTVVVQGAWQVLESSFVSQYISLV